MISGNDYTFKLAYNLSDGDAKEVTWEWPFTFDRSPLDISTGNLGWGLFKTETGYEASSSSEYDVTYEITYSDSDDNIVYMDLVDIKAGTVKFIPFSPSWKEEDETSKYAVRIIPMIEFGGMLRLNNGWHFSADYLPVIQ